MMMIKIIIKINSLDMSFRYTGRPRRLSHFLRAFIYSIYGPMNRLGVYHPLTHHHLSAFRAEQNMRSMSSSLNKLLERG